MAGNYPAGVTDNDPHFDLPNAHEDEDDETREEAMARLGVTEEDIAETLNPTHWPENR